MLLENESREDSVTLRSLAAGLSDRNIAVLHQGLDLIYDLVENLPDYWPVQDLLGRSDAESLCTDWAGDWFDAKAAVLTSGKGRTLEIGVPVHGGRKVLEARICPDNDSRGRSQGLITVLTDVTELRERELTLVNLMREVSHRSKNLLAIIQSIAAQTAQHSESIASFMQKFRGRLQALSGIQDLVTEANWGGIAFKSLVGAQIARIGQPPSEAVQVTGDNPMLGPNAALHIGLALHELVANAQNFGALSRHGSGSVSISAKLADPAERASELLVEWIEAGTGEIPRNIIPRFGTLVLERIVPLSVGGAAEHHLGDDGVFYRLHVPAGQFQN